MNEKVSQENGSLVDKVKDASLRFAGLSYIIGDSSIIARGLATGNKATMVTGLAWGSGGVGLSVFGKKPTAYQLKEAAQDLSAHLEKQGIEIPQESALAKDYLVKDNSPLSKIQKFCYDHPSEILNAVYAAGALFLMKGGYKEFKKSGDYTDMASGALVLGGALGGLFIKEKKLGLNEDGTPKKPENVIEWIQEKPLRVTGTLYSLNNLFPFMAAVKGHRAAIKGTASVADKHAYKLRYAQVGAFAAANALLGMSSKDGGHGGGATDFPKDDFFKHASEAITLQPEGKQAQALEAIAGFIAGDERFNMNKEQALSRLQQELGSEKAPANQVANAQPKGQLASSPIAAHAV